MRIIRFGKLYAVECRHYSPALRDVAKATAGMRWDAAARMWVGYPDALALLADALGARGITIEKTALRPPSDFGSPNIPIADKDLRAYQREAVRFLLANGPTGALLADSMGLGKSCSAATAARALDAKTLIVCPSYVRSVWRRTEDGKMKGEIVKWWRKAARSVYLPKGVKNPQSIPEDIKIVVIHPDILHAWVEPLKAWGFRTLILDEIHIYQAERSRRSQAVRDLRDHARVRFGLSGTPLLNRPKDLWNVVDILSPGRLGPFFQYGLRYCNGHKEQVTPEKIVWKFDGRSNLPELSKRLSYMMLRRTASDVSLQLPPKTRQIIEVDLPSRAQVSINLASARKSAVMRRYLDLAADGKLPAALELIKTHAQEGHKVVAFTYRRSVAEFLSDALTAKYNIGSSVIHGGVSQDRRNLRIAKARNLPVGEPHVLCATIDSTSTGIDMSYANVAVFVELTWEPVDFLQAEARLHRYGQALPVLIQYVIGKGSADEFIVSSVINKLETFESVVGPTGDGLRSDLDAGPKGDDALAALCDAIFAAQKKKAKKL